MSTRKRKPVRVPAPKPRSEEVVQYYEHAGDVIEQVFGRRPSRNALYKYLRGGFPVQRGGPYVLMPTYTALKRQLTTRQAMQRWVTVVRTLEREITNGD